ncbi:hypothetical protein [Photobacterium lucens]|uniref:hypothetical protein n=1 Tax=Photobacterium lucens TaxID=2562949 RepID=UPI001369647F|nr:hypothetical protein [Photobacterium lucens]MBP2699540.1 hypothetical protein [Vibrio parahaemolyticus]MZG55164.1 hypothetical protein [Photobacterium lucens]MZG82541.1 hypothetical protein [Photobacterium lucens]
MGCTEYIGKAFSKNLALLQSESDRGAVLVASSMIEEALKNLLIAKLVPSSKNQDPLFNGGNAPLGTFSSKIEMTYRLGLIRREWKELLNIFKKLRNDFAHNVEVNNFKIPKVRDQFVSLMDKDQHLRDALKGTFIESIANNVSPLKEAELFLKEKMPLRISFDFAFAVIVSTLEAIVHEQVQLKPFGS